MFQRYPGGGYPAPVSLESERVMTTMNEHARALALDVDDGKVPAVTLGFWIIKILATTLGETGGDAVTMSMNLGYLTGTVIFAALFAVVVSAQIGATRFNAFRYWAVIVATTTVGTTLADFTTRSLGIGYPGGSCLLAALLAASLLFWKRATGSISIASIQSKTAETYYWVTILFSQTLGTALGDWIADSGLGYGGGAIVFGAGVALTAVAYRWTKISHTALFWTAFILTRPLGATLGDFLDKPINNGGMAVSRYVASAGLAIAIVALVSIVPQRAARHD